MDVLIRHQDFMTAIPRRSLALLPPGQAQTAQDVQLWSGEIRPARELLPVASPTKGGAVLTIWFWANAYWLNWLTDVDVQRSFVANDLQKRIYWTGDGVPKKTDLTIGAGGADLPSASWFMGVKAPAIGPTLAASGGSGGAETRYYAYTYVTALEEEGAPSPPIAVQANAVGATVIVTRPATEPTPDPLYNIAKWRIYRSNSGSNTAIFQFVAEIGSLATTGYTDTAESANLPSGVLLVSSFYAEPPGDLQGLVTLPNGTFAGFHGKEICFSEPNVPTAWPVSYRRTVDFDIVGLGVDGIDLIVLTKGNTYFYTGQHPAVMTPYKNPTPYPCASKRSIVSTPVGVAFAGLDGILLARGGGVNLLTLDLLTAKDWQALNPASMFAKMYQGRMHVFYDPSGVGNYLMAIFDPNEPKYGFVTSPIVASAAFNDIETGLLYAVVGGKIQQWDGDPKRFRTGLWRSGKVQTRQMINLGAGEIRGDFSSVLTGAALAAYNAVLAAITAANAAIQANLNREPGAIDEHYLNQWDLAGDGWIDPPAAAITGMTFKLYGDEVLRSTQVLTAEGKLRLPPNYRAKEWEVEADTQVNIEQINIASSFGKLAKGQ